MDSPGEPPRLARQKRAMLTSAVVPMGPSYAQGGSGRLAGPDQELLG
jgi:hypothetical protein